jgi:hypothetical protein
MSQQSLYYILSERLAAPPPEEEPATPGPDLLALAAHGGHQLVVLNAFAWQIGRPAWNTPTGPSSKVG